MELICSLGFLALSTCKLGIIRQITGGALIGLAVGASIYHRRYKWLVNNIVEDEIDRVRRTHHEILL